MTLARLIYTAAASPPSGRLSGGSMVAMIGDKYQISVGA
jgi:hypothetical protein